MWGQYGIINKASHVEEKKAYSRSVAADGDPAGSWGDAEMVAACSAAAPERRMAVVLRERMAN